MNQFQVLFDDLIEAVEEASHRLTRLEPNSTDYIAAQALDNLAITLKERRAKWEEEPVEWEGPRRR